MTHDDLVAGICRQRGLNFSPGSRYLYSNSNFLLLGRVIEKASGQSLREFLDRRIFGPVGMSATRHVESPAESVPGLATGYFAADSGWWRAQHGFPLHGEGGLVSCVEDLALWHRHLGSPRGAALAESLTARMDFTNGRPNAYARGVGLRRHRGVNQDLDTGRQTGRPAVGATRPSDRWSPHLTRPSPLLQRPHELVEHRYDAPSGDAVSRPASR